MKRYLRRFSHMIAGFSRLEGIMRTVYNQYDSMVRPLQQWLVERGVSFELNTRVTDLGVVTHADEKTVSSIVVERDGKPGEIVLGAGDRVLITLGSMTEASSLGTMDAWALWRKIALNRPEFGRPAAFANHIDQSKWISFTTTLHEPSFLHAIEDITGNVPGEGGLVTFPDSKWLLSIVVPHQPHFPGQPEDVSVVWGYALSVDGPGDFVTKPMSSCSGREIMMEVLGHLRLRANAANILGSCTCIPCMMPFITSQFLRRAAHDRPQIVPEGWQNLAFMGQFCELPNDVVFTVEYSIRSAQEAVYRLLELNQQPPPVYEGEFDPKVLLNGFKALHDIVV
jgi:oleate hydratase